MLQLSLNEIPQNLFPMPIVKSHYEIQHLIDMKNEQENELAQDIQKQYKERTPMRKDQLISRQKRASTQQNDLKMSVRKVSDLLNYSCDQIMTQNSMPYHAIDCSYNAKQLNKQISQEQQFQIKQNQIQQMIKEKLYTTYCNSLKKKTKLNPILNQKIEQLAPFISKDKNLHQPEVRRMNQFLKLRSQSIPLNFNNDSMQNSVQRITSQPRNLKILYKTQQTRKIALYQPLYENKEVERIIRKLNKKTKKLLRESYPEIDPQPVVDYQKQILSKIELRQSTKKKLQESFKEIMQLY